MTPSCVGWKVSVNKYRLFPLMGILIILLAFFGCTRTANQPEKGIKRFDAIVASTLSANNLTDTERFGFKVIGDGGQRHYVTSLKLDTLPNEESGSTHWIAVVSVAKAGIFIDAANYEADRKHYPNAKEPSYAKRLVDVDVINIQTNYAPRGAFSGVSMTSLDDQYDVRIMASNLLPNNVTSPNFDHDTIGKMILEAYLKETNN